MEKSIETIWKEGFLKKDALIAPKINNLYNQKSIDVVEKFKRMYKINRIAIALFALIILPVSFLVKIPILGILMFLLFGAILIISHKFKNKLEHINKSDNSYVYLSSFSNFIKELVSTNTKLSRFLYPYVFVTLVVSFWFQNVEGIFLGEKVISKLLLKYPEMNMLFGLPTWGLLGALLIIILLAIFGGKIGQWDLNLVYSGIIKKIEGMLSEMEELRA